MTKMWFKPPKRAGLLLLSLFLGPDGHEHRLRHLQRQLLQHLLQHLLLQQHLLLHRQSHAQGERLLRWPCAARVADAPQLRRALNLWRTAGAAAAAAVAAAIVTAAAAASATGLGADAALVVRVHKLAFRLHAAPALGLPVVADHRAFLILRGLSVCGTCSAGAALNAAFKGSDCRKDRAKGSLADGSSTIGA
jgi:hypothetical protein